MIDPRLFAVVLALPLLIQGTNVPEVDVKDLAGKTDLIGKEVLVDGRVGYYHVHPPRGYDEIELDRSPVALLLPPNLAFKEAPRQKALRAQGTLRNVGNKLVMDVRTLQILPSDMDRLEAGLKVLPAGEYTKRSNWARWAARRALFYKDEPLRSRAADLEAECARLEVAAPATKTPEAVLAVATKARKNKVTEPTPGALAHKGFRMWIDQATSPAELQKINDQIRDFFPDSARLQESKPACSKELLAAYKEAPDAAYLLETTREHRTSLDRLLMADAQEKLMLAQVSARPADAFELSVKAREILPERPQLALNLRDQGLKAAEADAAKLRETELITLARQFENADQPQKALDLKRAWLENQRNRKLGPSDAEGRVGLAEKYISWLQDRTTAVSLLTEADQIDPQSAVETFRRLGYRREGGRWMEAGAPGQASVPEGTSGEAQGSGGNDPLLGLTMEEVIARQGKPTYRSIEMTQGGNIVQWVYETSQGLRQFVIFSQKPGSPSTVIRRFGLR